MTLAAHLATAVGATSALRWRSAPFGHGLAFACALVVSATAAAAAGSDVFTIANYPVDAHAADAVAAKRVAIADGEAAALRSLFKRLVPVTAYPRLRQLKIPNADAFLDGISVRSERNSSTEYIANLDFSFRPDAVRALLQRENFGFVEAQAPPLVLVPVWRADAQPLAGVDADAWRAAWSAVDVAHALTPLQLEPLKPGVLPETIAALAKGDTTLLRTFASEYGGEDRLVVAILVPLPAQKKLQVTLVGKDAVGSIAWVTSYRYDPRDPGYAVELAAIVSLGVLEGRWKASGARVQGPLREPGMGAAGEPSLPSPAPGVTPATRPSVAADGGDEVRLAVQFRDIGEWATISKRLSQVPGVDNIDVAGLSGRSARITLRFAAGVERLAEILPEHGLVLRDGGTGWVLSGQ